MEKVSIVIPLFNGSATILRALDSVVQQTYEGPIECVIINDCSTDNSVQIVEDYLFNYHGSISFRLIHHKKNKRQGAARNTGIKKTDGMYLCFLDADDELTPDGINHLMEIAKKYNYPEIVQGKPKLMYDENWMPNYSKLPEYTNNKEEIEKIHFDIPCVLWSKLVKRSLFTEKNMWMMENVIMEDEAWIFDLWKVLESIAVSQHEIYIQYLSEGSTCANPIYDDRIISMVKICDRYMSNHSPVNYNKAYRRLFCKIVNNRKIPKNRINDKKNIYKAYYELIRHQWKKQGIKEKIVLLFLLLPPRLIWRNFLFKFYPLEY